MGKMGKAIAGSPVTLIAGIALLGFGGVHFYHLAVVPVAKRLYRRK